MLFRRTIWKSGIFTRASPPWQTLIFIVFLFILWDCQKLWPASQALNSTYKLSNTCESIKRNLLPWFRISHGTHKVTRSIEMEKMLMSFAKKSRVRCRTHFSKLVSGIIAFQVLSILVALECLQTNLKIYILFRFLVVLSRMLHMKWDRGERSFPILLISTFRLCIDFPLPPSPPSYLFLS